MCAALHTTTHQVSVLFGSYLVSLLCLYCSSKKEARSTSTGPSNSSSNGLTLSSVTTRATHSSSVSPPSHQPQSRCAVCVCERVMCGCVCVCVCVSSGAQSAHWPGVGRTILGAIHHSHSPHVMDLGFPTSRFQIQGSEGCAIESEPLLNEMRCVFVVSTSRSSPGTEIARVTRKIGLRGSFFWPA